MWATLQYYKFSVHASSYAKDHITAMRDKFIMVSGITGPDTSVDGVLACAIGELDEVVIIGTHKDGKEYFASSIADGPNVNWMLDRAKKALIEIIDYEP